PVVRSFTSFDQAAQEAGMSRIYAGIHFLFSDTDGLTAGQAVATYDLAAFDVSHDQAPPRVMLDNVLPGGASNANVTITGATTDTLSGVAGLQVQVDNGSYAPLSFDAATGRFSFTTAYALDGSADGSHVLHFRATDLAGNVAAPVAFTFVLHTRVPTLTVTGPTDGGTLAAGATLTGTVQTGGVALTMLHYAFEGGTAMPVAFGTNGSFSQALDLSLLGAGPHTLTRTAQDPAGNVVTQTLRLTLAAATALRVSNLTPANVTADVGVTVRPTVTFTRPVDPTTLSSANFYATDTTGTKVAATIVPADDGRSAMLFFTDPLPGASVITQTVN